MSSQGEIEDTKEARGQERRRRPKRKSVRKVGISKQSEFIQIESEMDYGNGSQWSPFIQTSFFYDFRC